MEIPTEQLTRLCRRYRVRELALFGSAASGSFGEASDIDLLVTFEPEARVGFLALARMQRELEELLGRKVDLVPKGGLKPAIRDAVLSTARVLYAA
jgi:predicted nucleotidyltransferase